MLLVSLAASGAHAQGASATSRANDSRAQSWVHESWTVKDGLPVNSINALLQDRTGYIWAATFDGLVRFDGLRFTVFNSANSEELPSNRIIALKEGRDGSLWLATEQGHIVRFRAGRFTNIPFENAKPAEGSGTCSSTRRAPSGWERPTDCGRSGDDRLVRVGAERSTPASPPSCSVETGASGSAPTARGSSASASDGRRDEVSRPIPRSMRTSSSRMFEDASGTLWIAGTRGALVVARPRWCG